jgi:hypothetical protein
MTMSFSLKFSGHCPSDRRPPGPFGRMTRQTKSSSERKETYVYGLQRIQFHELYKSDKASLIPINDLLATGFAVRRIVRRRYILRILWAPIDQFCPTRTARILHEWWNCRTAKKGLVSGATMVRSSLYSPWGASVKSVHTMETPHEAEQTEDSDDSVTLVDGLNTESIDPDNGHVPNFFVSFWTKVWEFTIFTCTFWAWHTDMCSQHITFGQGQHSYLQQCVISQRKDVGVSLAHRSKTSSKIFLPLCPSFVYHYSAKYRSSENISSNKPTMAQRTSTNFDYFWGWSVSVEWKKKSAISKSQ